MTSPDPKVPELPPLFAWLDPKTGKIRDLTVEEVQDYARAYGAPLLVEIKRLKDRLASDLLLTDELDALRRFKTFVHRRLDTAGVPTHPDGPHSKEGCRIGDRLDIIIRERDELRAQLEAARKEINFLRSIINGCSSCLKEALQGWA